MSTPLLSPFLLLPRYAASRLPSSFWGETGRASVAEELFLILTEMVEEHGLSDEAALYEGYRALYQSVSSYLWRWLAHHYGPDCLDQDLLCSLTIREAHPIWKVAQARFLLYREAEQVVWQALR